MIALPPEPIHLLGEAIAHTLLPTLAIALSARINMGAGTLDSLNRGLFVSVAGRQREGLVHEVSLVG